MVRRHGVLTKEQGWNGDEDDGNPNDFIGQMLLCEKCNCHRVVYSDSG